MEHRPPEPKMESECAGETAEFQPGKEGSNNEETKAESNAEKELAPEQPRLLEMHCRDVQFRVWLACE